MFFYEINQQLRWYHSSCIGFIGHNKLLFALVGLLKLSRFFLWCMSVCFPMFLHVAVT